jgi:malonyl CoA-acyl carrier protein transacylase
MMEPVLQPLIEQIKRVRLEPPRLPFLSNVTGTWIRAEEATDPLYWAQHIRRPVRFAAGLSTLLAEPSRVLLEVGPGNALATLARQHPARQAAQVAVTSLRHARESGEDQPFLLGALAQLWLAGAEVDWSGFYAHERRGRVPLPTYPFERRRYWVDPLPAGAATGRAGAGRAARGRRLGPADWFYAPTWRRQPPVPPQASQAPLQASAAPDAAAAGDDRPARPVLLFTDRHGLAGELARRLAAAGREVYTAAPGACFERTGEHAFTLDPADGDGYDLLLEEICRQSRPPAAVLHLWAVEPDHGDLAVGALDAALDLTFYSLVHLAQAMGKWSLTEPAAVLVVSSGLQRVTGEEGLQPVKATLMGPCRVIPREVPNLSCRSLDLPAPPGLPAPPAGHAEAAAPERQRWLEAAATGVMAELALLGDAAGAQREAGMELEAVALRGGYRWVEAFEPLSLAPLASGAEPACLRPRGVYLVTGGLGGLGLEVAAWLAAAVAARLVLVGPTPLPDRADWDEWLAAHDVDNRVSRRIRRVRALEAAGAEVLVAAADAGDLQAMAAVRDEALERFGAIHGAFHAAGRPGGGILQRKTRAAAAAVLDPKVRGAVVLDQVLGGLPLDFLVLFSSHTAVLAQPGQADYAAANAFLDAFAEARCARGAATLAIGWDAWREVGMAVDTEVPAELAAWRRRELEQGLSSREGIEVLRRALATVDGNARLLISTVDFEVRRERGRRAAAALIGRAGTGSGASARDGAAGDAAGAAAADLDPAAVGEWGEWGERPSHPRPALANAYVPPRDDGERRIAGIWQDLLGIVPVGVHDSFFDLGGNSLMAIRVIARLKSDLGADVSEVSIFEGPTVASLAKLLAPGPEAEPVLQESRSRGERRLARRGQRGAAAGD